MGRSLGSLPTTAIPCFCDVLKESTAPHFSKSDCADQLALPLARLRLGLLFRTITFTDSVLEEFIFRGSRIQHVCV